MGVMDFVKKIASKKSEKSQKFKELEEDYKLQKMLEERQKSSNQRELEKYYKDQEEKRIKETLERIHKKQNKEAWRGKNLFAGKGTILNEDKKILSDDRPILKQKNIFMGKKNNRPMTKQELFFKC